MPFSRDINLDEVSVIAMKKAMECCRIEGGVLLVAPEHRLSLELNCKELSNNGSSIAKELHDFIYSDLWRDILDECDELLRHNFQLIYAVGSPKSLPQGPHRWRAIQAILEAIVFDNDIIDYLRKHQKACSIATNQSPIEWPSIQFFEGSPLESMLEELIPKIAKVIIKKPPYELSWISGHSLANDILKAITEKSECPSSIQSLPESYQHDVLALRGFLSGDILRHCLMKRHRVSYGVARPGKKRVAIPFRFADTPAERSEFAHPDCALALTVLAYYFDGLTFNEVSQTLKVLFSLGENAQRQFYNKWFQLSKRQMEIESSDCIETLNCVEKFDVSNEIQLRKVWHFYHRNMFFINFYLNSHVFPAEMEQFGQRLTATSWNLAHNPSGNIVGFSGTNGKVSLI